MNCSLSVNLIAPLYVILIYYFQSIINWSHVWFSPLPPGPWATPEQRHILLLSALWGKWCVFVEWIQEREERSFVTWSFLLQGFEIYRIIFYIYPKEVQGCFFFFNEQLYFFLQCSILDLSSLTRDRTCALWNGSMKSQWAIVEVILCVLNRFSHVWLFAALWAMAHRMAHRLLCP